MSNTKNNLFDKIVLFLAAIFKWRWFRPNFLTK